MSARTERAARGALAVYVRRSLAGETGLRIEQAYSRGNYMFRGYPALASGLATGLLSDPDFHKLRLGRLLAALGEQELVTIVSRMLPPPYNVMASAIVEAMTAVAQPVETMPSPQAILVSAAVALLLVAAVRAALD